MSYLWPYQLYDFLRCVYYLWKSFKAFLYKRNSKRKTYFQRTTVELDKTIVSRGDWLWKEVKIKSKMTVLQFMFEAPWLWTDLWILFTNCDGLINATFLLVSKIKILGIIPIIFILLTNEKTRQD